jgi:hypothetical protein
MPEKVTFEMEERSKSRTPPGSYHVRERESTLHLSFEVLDCWKKQARQLAAKLGAKGMRKKEEDLNLIGFEQAVLIEEEGSSSGDESEDDELEMVVRRAEGFWNRFLLHPNCVTRGVWEVFSLFLVVYDIVWIPLQLMEPEDNVVTVMMEWTTRLYWTADIGASCITGFVTTDGFIELRPRRIVFRYIKTWFGLDLMVVGIDWIEILWSAAQGAGYARIGRAARAFRIIRMVRLLRLLRIKELIKIFFESVRSESIKEMSDMIKIVLLILMSGHLFACFWYGLGISNIEPGSWVDATFLTRHSLGYRYASSLHWSLSMYGGGMDEIRPVNISERIYAIVVFVFTLMVGTVLVSSLTSSMTQLNILATEKKNKMTMLRKYLVDNRITTRLTLRVQRNAQHALHEQETYIPEAHVELLELVSEPLRIEVHFELYSRVLKHHPFFEEYIENCPHIMQKVCHHAPSMMGVSSGDIIFNVGEIPPKPKMIMIASGVLQYVSISRLGACASAQMAMDPRRRGSQRRSMMIPPPNTKGATVLEPGSWIAEPVLWTHWMHRGILTAKTDARLCLLDALKFQDQVTAFDHDEFNPKVYAAGFVDALNKTEDLTDFCFGLEALALESLNEHVERVGEAKQKAVDQRGRRRASISAVSPVVNRLGY